MTDTPRLWTVQEVAAATRLTERRVRQLLQSGNLQGRKVGRDWLISDEEAVSFIEDRSEEEHADSCRGA